MLFRLENSPPRAMFITCSGRKSGEDRAAPIVATRSCVCGLPGLLTMTTRGEILSGDVNDGRAGVPRCHEPNDFSASARSSVIEMSPATTSAALLATKFCCQNDDRSFRAMALTDASVPISLYPYGCFSPYSTIAVTCDATCDGLSRCC